MSWIIFFCLFVCFFSDSSIEETGKMDTMTAYLIRNVLLKVQMYQKGEKLGVIAAQMLVFI